MKIGYRFITKEGKRIDILASNEDEAKLLLKTKLKTKKTKNGKRN